MTVELFPYIETIFCIYNVVNMNADKKRDGHLKGVAMMIYNYVIDMAKEHSVNLKEIKRPEKIEMKPLYEYIRNKNIQLFDLNNMKKGELDVKCEGDIERYMLSHIFLMFKLHR